MNFFKKAFATLRFNEAIKRAEKAHEMNGERYYIMPIHGSRGKLVIIDRRNFRKMKSKGYIDRNATVNDLINECFYCTSYSNGSGKLPEFVSKIKKSQYYGWFEETTSKKVRKH